MKSWKLLAKLTAVVIAATVLAPQPGVAAEKTVRLALQTAPLLGFYVRDKQLLEKRGFKSEWSVFPFSPPILEAMAGGSIDIGFLGVPPFLNTSMKEAGIWYIYDELANAAGLVVRTDSTIRGPADLKGKKIVFPGKASQQYAQLRMYLAGTPLTDADVDLVRANAADMTTLFQRKEVEGMLAWPPFTSDLVRTGAARSLFTADDLLKQKGGHWLNAGWGVRAAYARDNEDAVLATIDALHEATRMLQTNPEEVYAVFAKATGYTVESLRFMIKEGYNAYYDPKDTAPSVAAMKQTFDVLEKYGVVTATKPIDPVLQALIHPEFVNKVLAKGR